MNRNVPPAPKQCHFCGREMRFRDGAPEGRYLVGSIGDRQETTTINIYACRKCLAGCALQGYWRDVTREVLGDEPPFIIVVGDAQPAGADGETAETERTPIRNTKAFREWMSLTADERERQTTLWGRHQDLTPEKWICVLLEEIGEAAQAINDGRLPNARGELVQAAAVLASMYEALYTPQPATEPADAAEVSGDAV